MEKPIKNNRHCKKILLPTSLGLISMTSVTSVKKSVTELPSSLGLTSITFVTSVTSDESESVAELPFSFGYIIYYRESMHPKPAFTYLEKLK